jgi:hypothetical protein
MSSSDLPKLLHITFLSGFLISSNFIQPILFWTSYCLFLSTIVFSMFLFLHLTHDWPSIICYPYSHCHFWFFVL